MNKNKHQQRFNYYVSRSVVRESRREESRHIFWLVLFIENLFFGGHRKLKNYESNYQ